MPPGDRHKLDIERYRDSDTYSAYQKFPLNILLCVLLKKILPPRHEDEGKETYCVLHSKHIALICLGSGAAITSRTDEKEYRCEKRVSLEHHPIK